MGAEVRDRRLLEHDLRHAISRRELRLVYQPQQDVRSGETVGFEALLRWKHETRGEISPSVFIPIAEESGAILQIGEWVLRAACREAVTWQRPPQVAFQQTTVARRRPHGGLEEATDAPAVVLGPIEGGVGMGEKRVAVGGIVGTDGNADAG